MKALTRAEIREILSNTDNIINFSNNWNNKLSFSIYYTTIRLHNDVKYKPGQYYQVHLKNNLQHLALLVRKKTFLLSELPEITAYQDTGYGIFETKRIFEKMYPGTDWKTQKLDLLLLKNVEQK